MTTASGERRQVSAVRGPLIRFRADPFRTGGERGGDGPYP